MIVLVSKRQIRPHSGLGCGLKKIIVSKFLVLPDSPRAVARPAAGLAGYFGLATEKSSARSGLSLKI